MSLHDVILSLLREPMSGTDLTVLFQSSIGHFWNADLSQIYRTLDALERAGCVRSKSVPSPRGPARRVYRMTERGQHRLDEWIRRPPKIPRVKFEYAAQLFSVTRELKPAVRAREILVAIRAEAMPSLLTLRAIDRYMQGLPGYPDRLEGHFFYPWLTLRHGLLRRESLVAWVDECLTHLDRRPEDADDSITHHVLSVLSEMLKTIAEEAETSTATAQRGDNDA